LRVSANRRIFAARYDRLVAQATAEDGGQDTAPERTQKIWSDLIDELAQGRGKTKAEQPLVALYAEASGWYEFRGSRSDLGGRQKNLFTVSVDYWFVPGRDDVLLRIRYENGFERGVPGERKNQLLASVALKF